MTRALVTGATAGIGAEFARQLAARGDDLVLVARTADRLEVLAAALRAEHRVDVEVLAADLLDEAGLARVDARLAQAEHPVDLLINNAGFGLVTDLVDSTLEQELQHLALHVTVPLQLSRTALRGMLPRGSGRVVLSRASPPSRRAAPTARRRPGASPSPAGRTCATGRGA